MQYGFIKRFAIPSSISTYLSRTLIIVTVATTMLIGGVLIISQSIYFTRLSNQKSIDFIENQKIDIQDIVNNELEYIRIQNELFKKSINHKIRQNVNQALLTAESIYKQYAGKKSDQEIKALIIATISSLKFDMEYEEVFISGLNGIGVYYPRKPEFAGKDMNGFKDVNGKSVIQSEIKLLQDNDEGFLDYELSQKPEVGSTPHKKVTFVKKFGHFNWYFGSKQYVDDYFPKFREEIAEKISTVRFRHGGYVFMNHVDGTPIVMDGKIYSGDLNLLHPSNDKRHPVFLKELEVTRNNPDGGYFYYKWNKINDTIPSEKCAYVKLFKEYDWIVGAGFYMDEINQSIVAQQKILKSDQQRSILIIFLILIALLFGEAIIIYRFNKRYKSDFERFFNFFYQSQDNYVQLDIADFYFEEFRKAAQAANKMIVLREENDTRLIQEQKKATESDRLKTAFLANMSHEIRTPMNAIIGFSELLEDKSQNVHDHGVFIRLIRKNGELLLSLINDIMDISKIEANALTVKRKPLKLLHFLNEINVYYTDALATKKDKTLQFELITDIGNDVRILTDEIRLKQILDNLIGNAIKFTHEGSVKLKAILAEGMLHFSISDTGIGIPEDQYTAIFERFRQANHSSYASYGGTGLGLPISKNLIGLLGGKIWVSSELGKGSVFEFTIRID